MATNNLEIIVQAPENHVWAAVTTTQVAEKWMKDIKITTDWKVGSPVVYTCYDDKGEIFKWEGMNMIWSGIIEKLDRNQEYTASYPDKSAGLVKESYFFDTLDEKTTKVRVTQEFTTQEIADGYKDGTQHLLGMLKTYLEA